MFWFWVLVVLVVGSVLYPFRYHLLLFVGNQEIGGDALEGADNALREWRRADRYDSDTLRRESMVLLQRAIGLAEEAGIGGYGALRFRLEGEPGAREMFAYYDALPEAPSA